MKCLPLLFTSTPRRRATFFPMKVGSRGELSMLVLVVVFAAQGGAAQAAAPATPAAEPRAASASAPPESVQLGQGVVLRLAGQATLYVVGLHGGIDALEVLNGKQRWHSSAAAFPLFTRAGELLAIGTRPAPGGAHRLVVLDAETGKQGGELPPLPAEALVGETSTSRGEIEVQSRGGRDLLVWTAERLPPGVSPPPPGRQVQGLVTHGAVVVDLLSRKLSRIDPPGPEAGVPHRDRIGVLPGPFEIDGVRVEVVDLPTPSGEAFGLRRDRGGRALPDTVLDRGDLLLLSADLRHVLSVTDASGPPYPSPTWALTVWSTVTGQGVLGWHEFMTHDFVKAFVMLGDQMVFHAWRVERTSVRSEWVGVFDPAHFKAVVFDKPIRQPLQGRTALAPRPPLSPTAPPAP
jgi:hypothetical protein